MIYERIPGYVSGLVLSKDEKTIKAVKVVGFPEGKTRDIPSSLFIHTHNEAAPFNDEVAENFCSARDSITALLDAKIPYNGLMRDATIFPRDKQRDIELRIDKPWKVSLEDDSVLRKEIENLVEQQNREQVAIVVSGDNAMIERVTLFAAAQGYRGQFLQVVLPRSDSREAELKKKLDARKKACVWREVEGRLVKDGTDFNDNKFTLGVHNSKGEFVHISDVDVIINAAGRTRNTPLVEGMKAKGYISETYSERIGVQLNSDHQTLFGPYSFFQTVVVKGIKSPSLTIWPLYDVRVTEPWGWEDVFFNARRILDRQ